MKGQLHHVELYVQSLNESRLFWDFILRELGYELFQEWEDGFSFKLGNCYIVFVQTETEFLQYEYHRKRTGLNHLAFHLDNKTELDLFTQKIKQKQIKLLYHEQYPNAGGGNYQAVYFEDPNGIKVELVVTENSTN